MHFYSDVNIFGLNEVVLINYKYRKNLMEPAMKMFQKVAFNNCLSQNLFDLNNMSLDLTDLEKTSPNLFSHLTYHII